jgi:hypothetical protein
MTIDEVMTRARRSGGGAAGDASDAMAAAASTPAAIMAIFACENQNGRWHQNNYKNGSVLFTSVTLHVQENVHFPQNHSPDLQSMRIHQPFPRGSRKP